MNDKESIVYLIRYLDGSVYVGSTYDPMTRKHQHKRDSNQCNSKLKKGLVSTFHIVSDWHDPEKAFNKEKRLAIKLNRKGINVLNDMDNFYFTGFGKKNKWTRDKTIHELSKFQKLNQVQRNDIALYNSMKRYRLDKVVFPIDYRWNKVKQLRVKNMRKTLNKQWLIDNQHKYKNRKELKKKNGRLFDLLVLNDWDQDIVKFKSQPTGKEKEKSRVKRRRLKYNLYDAYVIAKKVKTSTELRNKSYAAYKMIRDNDMFHLFSYDYINPTPLKWTEQAIKELARGLKNITEMKRKYDQAYRQLKKSKYVVEFSN